MTKKNEFVFSKRSLNNLQGVHPDLVSVAKLALKYTEQDFTITEGVRSLATQKRYVQEKKSQTMNSKHLKQTDGYGHAIDIVPYPVSWDLEKFYPVVDAFKKAADELGVRLRWGGSWDYLFSMSGKPELYVQKYVTFCRNNGKKAFIDAPHFELVK